MPPRRLCVPIERIVDQARLRTQETSVRKVAKEIGLSPAGLTKVLAGAKPHESTRRKLEDWFVRDAASTPTESANSIDAALLVLLRQVPQEQRASLREAIEAILRSAKSV